MMAQIQIHPPCLLHPACLPAQTYSVCTPGSELDSRILNCSGGNNCDYNFVIKTCQMMKPIQIPPPLLSCAPPPVTQPQFHSTSAANSPPFENIKYDFAVFAFLNEKKTSFLALLGKNFPEKLSGLSVKGGGYPPFPLRNKTFFFSD